MLSYAEKLTSTPSDMGEADIDRLRDAGLSNRNVLDLVEVIAYFAYANHIADGLSITLEPWIDFDEESIEGVATVVGRTSGGFGKLVCRATQSENTT